VASNDDGKGRGSSSSFGEPLERACGIGPCPISLDFGANSTKVSFVNIEEQDREDPPRHAPTSNFEMEKFSSVGASHSITPPSSQSDMYPYPSIP